MGPLIGFVTVPRSAESHRPTGAFFSAAVEAKVGPGTWRVNLDGRTVVVTTSLDLVPGQSLKLKLVSQAGGRWVLQTVTGSMPQPVPDEASALMAAFVSRGLPLAADKLAAWTRWLGNLSGPVDKETWAASLEARGQGPNGSAASAMQPWLDWQASLEQGKYEDPPDDDYWDFWNSRRTAAGDPWLVMPLRWVYEGTEDTGMLQAHWNPQAQAIDRWNLTACPAGTPFRLEARTKPGSLDLTWRFFNDADRTRWTSLVPALEGMLSTPEFRVGLKVTGQDRVGEPLPRGGIDVQA